MTQLAILSPEQLAELVDRAVDRAVAKMPRNDLHEVMTRDQAAEFLQCHPAVLTRYVRREGLPSHKLGREWRFKRSELIRWLEGRK